MTSYERKILTALLALFLVLALLNAYFYFKHQVHLKVTTGPRPDPSAGDTLAATNVSPARSEPTGRDGVRS